MIDGRGYIERLEIYQSRVTWIRKDMPHSVGFDLHLASCPFLRFQVIINLPFAFSRRRICPFDHPNSVEVTHGVITQNGFVKGNTQVDTYGIGLDERGLFGW